METTQYNEVQETITIGIQPEAITKLSNNGNEKYAREISEQIQDLGENQQAIVLNQLIKITTTSREDLYKSLPNASSPERLQNSAFIIIEKNTPLLLQQHPDLTAPLLETVNKHLNSPEVLDPRKDGTILRLIGEINKEAANSNINEDTFLHLQQIVLRYQDPESYNPRNPLGSYKMPEQLISLLTKSLQREGNRELFTSLIENLKQTPNYISIITCKKIISNREITEALGQEEKSRLNNELISHIINLAKSKDEAIPSNSLVSLRFITEGANKDHISKENLFKLFELTRIGKKGEKNKWLREETLLNVISIIGKKTTKDERTQYREQITQTVAKLLKENNDWNTYAEHTSLKRENEKLKRERHIKITKALSSYI